MPRPTLVISTVTENNAASTLPRIERVGSADLQKAVEIKKGFPEEETCWQRGECE